MTQAHIFEMILLETLEDANDVFQLLRCLQAHRCGLFSLGLSADPKSFFKNGILRVFVFLLIRETKLRPAVVVGLYPKGMF